MLQRFLLLLATACLSTWILAPTVTVAQQPGVEFAVVPGPNSQLAPGGGYFLIQAGTGQAVRQSLTLRNESGRSVTLTLAAVDATTGQLGGVSYGLPDDPVESTGSWITLDKTKVSLGPAEVSRIGFKLNIPDDATGGEHIAGIAVWEANEQEKGGDEAVAVVVQTRRIIAVQIDLPGPKIPELVVTGVEPAARPDGLYLEIGIENRGSAMTTGEGLLEIPAQAFVREFAVDTFVPATAIGYPVKWTEDPQEGTYEASVELEYEGEVAEWSGTFTVGDPVIADLEDRGVAVAGRFPVVPVALGVGGLAAAMGLWYLRRRSHPAAVAPIDHPISNPLASGHSVSPAGQTPPPVASSRPPGTPPPPPPAPGR